MSDQKQEDIVPPSRAGAAARARAPLRAVFGWAACLFAAVVLCFWQFRVDHFGPLAAAAVILGVVWFFRPYLGPVCLHIWLLGAALFLADVFWLRHRLAVGARVWAPLFHDSALSGIHPSPSGKSTIYSVNAGFMDPVDVIYVSDGGWFPRLASDGFPPPHNPHAPPLWSGSVFSLRRLRYDESTGRITGPSLLDPPTPLPW